MRKFRLYYDKDKEEAWLNEMCQKGWAMERYSLGCYTFQPCAPGKYIYRIDLPMKSKEGRDQAKRDYIQLVEETGGAYVCEWFVWLYFRKESAAGEFELYTDYESKISLYRRIRGFFIVGAAIEFYASMINLGGALQGMALSIFAMALAALVGGIISLAAYRAHRQVERLEREKAIKE